MRKAKPKPPAAPEAPTPPEGWQRAPYRDLVQLAKNYPDWFEQLTAKTPNEIDWRPTATKNLQPELKRTVFVLLTAQLRYWRKVASDLEECLKDARVTSRVPARVIKSVLAGIAVSEIEERDQPVFGGFLTSSYGWLADSHHGPNLSLALGYKAKSFQDLRKACKISAADRGGRGRKFTFRQAMLLLEKRLARKRPDKAQRKAIADQIWENVKHEIDAQRRQTIRRVLTTTGASCAELPESKPQPSGAASSFYGNFLGSLGLTPP